MCFYYACDGSANETWQTGPSHKYFFFAELSYRCVSSRVLHDVILLGPASMKLALGVRSVSGYCQQPCIPSNIKAKEIPVCYVEIVSIVVQSLKNSSTSIKTFYALA